VERSLPSTPYRPTSYTIGNAPKSSGLQNLPDSIKLDSKNSVLTLDYGAEVGGWPFVEVNSVKGSVQIELKYSESFVAQKLPYGDGPFPFTNGLSNSYRVERFNITCPGHYESLSIQGGLRWQTIRIIGSGSITFSKLGLRPSVDIKPLEALPGSFSTSNKAYTDIWGLGPRAAQAVCVEAGTQPASWQLSKQGAYIQSQTPALSVKGFTFSNYTLEFDTKIDFGGLNWKIATNTGFGFDFVLTSKDYVGAANANVQGAPSFPPNALLAGYGWSIVNQTTLPSAEVQIIPLKFNLHAGKWYHITTQMGNDGYTISINKQFVATISYQRSALLSNPVFSTGNPRLGSWGFGAYQNQAAYFTNVVVTSDNGTTIYSNKLTSQSVLAEYGVDKNQRSVCLDGAKRDRLVWTGDFAVTSRTVLSSTNRLDFLKGTFDFVFDYQLPPGPGSGSVNINGALGTDPADRFSFFPGHYFILDYEIFVLTAIGDYYRATGDIKSLQQRWPQIQKLTESVLQTIDPSTNLVAGMGLYFISDGATNSTAPTALLATTLDRLAPVASVLGDNTTATRYLSISKSLKASINNKLWNKELQTYSVALGAPDAYALTSTAFAILSGTADTTRASSSIQKLQSLFYKIGYVSSSLTTPANDTQLSPFFQGFLLESLFYAYKNLNVSADVVVPVIKNLLDQYWSRMLQTAPGNNEYYSGASWEYLYPDGSPGIGVFTSLSHPWASAPTYVFHEYILGVAPITAGYKTWSCESVLGGALGLTFAEGRVPTPSGAIDIRWDVEGDDVIFQVQTPTGTTGYVSLKGKVVKNVDGAYWDGKSHNVTVNGGTKAKITFI